MSEEQMSWSEVVELTHATQVERFNFCLCEEGENYPYDDCPINPNYVGYCLDCDEQLSAENVRTHDCTKEETI